MRVIGVDLAAKERNPTGIAIMDGSKIKTLTLFYDFEILNLVVHINPSVIAMDAPLTLKDRYAERYLKRYGAMSLNIPSIRLLAIRGLKLKEDFEKKGFKVIEVFPTATAKILGFYKRNKMEMLSYFKDFSVDGARNKHEVDAIIAAYTAYLHLLGKSRTVDGVVIPE